MIRVRFVPTPTGYLFITGARVALVNYLFARRHSGRMVLRYDDLDPERSRSSYVEAIAHDLHWLGIGWDHMIHQSDRLGLYQAAIETLKKDGRLYPCFESEEELRAKRDYRQKRGQPTVYDRAMLTLTPAQRAAAEAGGKRPYWRFKLSDSTVQWRDMILGHRQAKLPAVSDPILVLANGRPTPILASVVDDIDLEITHVIRAEDNAGNTGIQLDLLTALGKDPGQIRFAHLPPLSEAGRSRLGRRVGSLSLRGLRNDGIEPCALSTFLAAGDAAGPRAPVPLSDLAHDFNLEGLAGAASRFDAGRLLALNRQALAHLDFTSVADRLPMGATEAFWLAIRGDLDLLNEARGWWDVVAGTIVPPVIEDEHDLLLSAEALLPPEPWDTDVWATWLAALGAETGGDAASLTPPLRLALTGEEHGPDMASLLPLIGRVRAANRLRIAAS